jgi:hypothetical protein
LEKTKLNISTLPFEIAHYVSDRLKIFSIHRKIIFIKNQSNFIIKAPFVLFDIFGFSRILRRLFRLDKCNIYPLDSYGNEFLLIRYNKIYKYSNKKIVSEFNLGSTRNILHNPLCKTPDGRIFIGEYSSNRARKSVKIYASDNNGENWYIIYSIPQNKIKHIHGIFYDIYTDSLWIATGDNNGECYLINSDKNFKEVKYMGDGTQLWRACNMFFQKDQIIWLMDTPDEIPYVIHLSRVNKFIRKGAALPGPIIYSKQFDKNTYLAVTSAEPGKINPDKEVFLLLSYDLKEWVCINKFEKDLYSMKYFQFGNISLANGPQTLKNFYLSFQSVKKLDGKVGLCELS